MQTILGGRGYPTGGWGTRMGTRIAITAALITALVVMLLLAADAHGGTYEVRQCQHQAPQNHGHEALTSVFPSPGPYSVAAGSSVCSSAVRDYAIQAEPSGVALNGQYGLARFVAPEGTELVGVELNARLRNESGHRARLAMANAAGIEKVRFAAGASEPTGFSHYSWQAPPPAGDGYEQFTAGLFCDNPGSICPITGGGDRAKADIRDVKLTIRDDVPPIVSLSGELVAGGWVRGESSLRTDRHDDRRRACGQLAVSCQRHGRLRLVCTPLRADRRDLDWARRLSPCARRATNQIDAVDTINASIRRRQRTTWSPVPSTTANRRNVDCAVRTVKVDNTPPDLSFVAGQSRADPERIRAIVADAASGMEPGTATIAYRPRGATAWSELPTDAGDNGISARINSEALPPGDYEFQAAVSDVAGNRATTTTRTDGEPMVLRFPLKTPATLRATLANGEDSEVVGYRRESRVQGRLLDPAGEPIPGQEITVVETFADGSLIDVRRRTVETDPAGRYRSTLPGGPSRNVAVVYAGSRQYRGDSEEGLDLDVRGDARLKISRRRVRAGSSVSFRGRVKRYFARIPAGGKLVEVQVKSGRSWTTLQEATGTDRTGTIVLRHRFRGFYTQPVTFTFRLKATRENGWPYHGAAKSPRQRVTVVPKR